MNASDTPTRHAFSAALGRVLLLLAAVTLAGCETTSSGAPVVQAAQAPAPPMTHQEAAAQCWMGTEKGHADMPLDKRADVVSKCIDQKMGKTDAPTDSKPAPKT